MELTPSCTLSEVPSGLPPALRASGDPVRGDSTKGIIRKPAGLRPPGFLFATAASASELAPASAPNKKNRLTAVLRMIPLEVPSGFEPL